MKSREFASGKAVIAFDYDGVIADTLDMVHDAWRVIGGKFGFSVPSSSSEFARWFVRDWREVVQHHVGRKDKEAVRQASEIYAQYIVQQRHRMVSAFPGITDTVRSLSRHALLAVVTRSPRAYVEEELDRFGIAQYFSFVCGGDDVVEQKPHPAALELLMERTGATPDSLCYIGDMVIDIHMGRRAGARMVVGAGYGWHGSGLLSLHAPDAIADHPRQLEDIVLRSKCFTKIKDGV